MGFTAVAVVGGLVLALLLGGRPSNLATATLRWPAMLVAGLVLQWGPELLGSSEAASFTLIAASYACLVVFAVANLRLVGMPIVLLGLAMNTAVIGVNGGMPVRAEAVVAADLAEDIPSVAELDFGAKRHLEDGQDRLTFLGDIVPVPWLGEVLSFGDLILSVGVGNLLFRLLKPRHRRRSMPLSEVLELDDDVVIDLRPAPQLVGSRRAAS